MTQKPWCGLVTETRHQGGVGRQRFDRPRLVHGQVPRPYTAHCSSANPADETKLAAQRHRARRSGAPPARDCAGAVKQTALDASRAAASSASSVAVEPSCCAQPVKRKAARRADGGKRLPVPRAEVPAQTPDRKISLSSSTGPHGATSAASASVNHSRSAH
jgi:hypothetical protein